MNSQNITLAKFAGFCYGVKRAVETAVKLKEENPNKNIYVLGELIHNTDVIKELDSSDMDYIENLIIETYRKIDNLEFGATNDENIANCKMCAYKHLCKLDVI